MKVNKQLGYKHEPIPAPGKESYSYSYFLPYKDSGYLWFTVYEHGDDFTGAIEKHRKILESIEFGDEK